MRDYLAVQDGDFSTLPVSINVNIGDVFGFRAATDTNSDGPPIFTVYTPVPEPLTILGSITSLGFGTFFKRRLAKANKKKSDS